MNMRKFLKSTFGFCLSAFVINGFWHIFTDKFGVLGVWLSAFIIPGTMWILNHGFEKHLIHQTGSV